MSSKLVPFSPTGVQCILLLGIAFQPFHTSVRDPLRIATCTQTKPGLFLEMTKECLDGLLLPGSSLYGLRAFYPGYLERHFVLTSWFFYRFLLHGRQAWLLETRAAGFSMRSRKQYMLMCQISPMGEND